MKLIFTVPVLFLLVSFFKPISAQDKPIHPTFVGIGTYLGETPPLRDLPPLSPAEVEALKERALKKAANKKFKPREYPFSETALPKGPDEVWQKTMGGSAGTKAPVVNFEGQTTSSFPPDCNGAVGPNHYMQTVNVTYSIYNKTGTLLAGPTALNTLFTGVPGATSNDGDPIVLYDEMADRWFVAEFTINLSNDYMLVAVSATNDPTGTWYKYSFDVTNDPDYPKFGIWQDGYYMGINSTAGNDIYVFERAKMLQGLTAQFVGFDNSWRPGTGFLCVPPLDNDGVAAPAGAPGTFIAFNDDAVSGGSDQLWIYELNANWTTPSSSTFNRVQQIGVTAFDSQFTASWDDISQPTSQKLDGVPQVIMNAPQYRNFGSYQTIVCCHTVDVDATNHAGIRWYELRRGTQTSGNWAVRQQGTYAPDAHSRWMGSIMLNNSGKIGLGYSISSSTVYPGIRYCGQSASAYAAASGVLDLPEEIIHSGTVAQTTYNRWGDYAYLSVDPVDNETFWFSSEYVKTGGTNKGTKIASFKFGNAPSVVTQAASSVTTNSATLNGTVNPNGLATTYYFQYGLTTSYTNSTTITSAGSGTSTVAVNAPVSSLVAGQTYHFRLVATNSDGTTNGSDMTFSPGGAILTTTAVTSVTSTTALSGGNITSDGGSPITARGVCWATTVNPVATGLHTTDGSGTGSFTSNISGLSSNTVYHVRAYATNTYGTFYGSDIQFTTLCGVSSLPLSEVFSGSTLPACWSTQYSGSGATDKWTVSATTNAGGTANEMKSTYQNINPAVNRLVTIPLNTVGVSSLNLSFRHMLDAYGTGCTLRIQSSTDGINWTNEAWSVATTATNIAATTVNTTIANNLNSPNTMVAFTVEGNLYQYDYWYIDNVSISAVVTLATVTTSSVSNITTTSATSGGNVTSIGGSAVTAKGVCWSTTADPVATGNHTTDGSGTGAFTSSITGLSANTLYYVRAYATNSSGTAYGSNQTFTTCASMLPVSVNVSASLNPVCAGSSVNFTAVPVNGGTTPSYQWKVNGLNVGTNSATFSYTPSNNDIVSCVLTSNASCISGNPATSNNITMTVNPVVTASVSVTPSVNPVCAGTSVNFTAVPVNGGTTPSYQWKVNGSNVGTNSATYSYTPSNNNIVSCVLTSNASCVSGSPATSNSVTMTVNPTVTASVSVTASVNPVCAGTSVNFTAVPVNGGTTPSYQWKVNGSNVGTNSAAFSYVPAANDVVSCVLTSNAGCVSGSPATSNSITMTVNPIVTASVSVTPSLNPVCAGTSVDFAAVPVNGGTTPSYQWKVNGSNVGTNSAAFSYVPAASDIVSCVLTSNASCVSGSPATSNSVSMTVNPVVTASISISASMNSVCSGTTVEFAAIPTNGGSNPVYQWKVNGLNAGTNTADFTYVPADNDQVSCELTSDATCITGNPAVSNIVLMEVNPILSVGIEVTASENPVLAGTEVTFTATSLNGGVNPVYQWKVNNVNVGVNASTYSYVPQDGDQVLCELTSDVLCPLGNPATSVSILMGVTPLQLQVTPPVQTVGSASGSFNYSVQSNTGWTVSSDQSWCTVTLSGSGNGVITATYDANTGSVDRSSNITVMVTGLTPVTVVLTQEAEVSKQLTLNVLLEGLYNGSTLNKAQNTGGSQYPGNISDHITVELHASTTPYALIGGPYDAAILTDGTAEVQIPVNLNSSYYLVVKHRNSLETWSSNPVSFAGASISYDFSSSSGQSLGNNMKLKNGKYVLYTGDINQDGLIDQLDMMQLNTDADGFISGYTVSDLNGDALIDADDMILLDNNAAIIIVKITP